MSNTSNNLSFTPFNQTPGTNKLSFESDSGTNVNDDNNHSNNDNNINYGSRTPFQVIPMEFDSLKKYNMLESSKASAVFNSGGDKLNYSLFDTSNITANKLKMPQVERRAKRHFHESFMDLFDSGVMNDYSENSQSKQSSLQQPMPTSMLLNKFGKQRTGLTRSAGHLNLSLSEQSSIANENDDLPIFSSAEANSNHKTINEKINTWSQSPYANDTKNQPNDIAELRNNDYVSVHKNLSNNKTPSSGNQHSLKKVFKQEVFDKDSYEKRISKEQKENSISLFSNLAEKEALPSLYHNENTDSGNLDQFVFASGKNAQICMNNKSGVSPLPSNSNYWPSSAESNTSFKPWNTNGTSPNVGSYTDMFNKASSSQENFLGTKLRKTSRTDSEKLEGSNPSFIDAKPDQTIFNSNKLVSKFSLNSSHSHGSSTSGSNFNNSNMQASSYSESCLSENSTLTRNKQAVPDTPIKKPINMQLQDSFLNNKSTIFEDDENMDENEETEYVESLHQENTLKLSFHNLENKNNSKNNSDVYKRSPTNMNHSNRYSRGTTASQRNSKVFHKPNNSVTTITTINSNLSTGASIDTQTSLNRQSMIIGSDLNISLQKLTDDLYGDDDIMDVEKNISKATPTKHVNSFPQIKKKRLPAKNQFSTPQKNDVINSNINEKQQLIPHNAKLPHVSLLDPISLEYRSNTPVVEFISPDSKLTTSINIKNNEDDMHYSYLISKFSKVEEIKNLGSFSKVFKVTKNISNSKSLVQKGNKADVFAVKCMSAHNNKGSYLNVLNEIHILQTILKYRDAYKLKVHDCRKNKKRPMNETAVRYNGHNSEEINFEDFVDESFYIFDFITSWKHDGGYYIISDYYENGTLNDFIQKQLVNPDFRFDDFRIWKIIVEVCHGLNFIHKHCKIVHLDLKPSNIFVTFEGSLKIGDFGLSTKLPLKGQHFENEGDREYIAPEIIHDSVYDFKADIFSLGLMIVELACNVVLPDNGQVWQRLRSGNISDIGRISSTEINMLINDTIETRSNSPFVNSRLTPLSSASNFIGISKLSEIERHTGKSIPAWVPKFLIDGISLDKTVKWMIDPDYKKRPSAKEILLTEECEYIGMSKKSGAVIFEGDYGVKLERF